MEGKFEDVTTSQQNFKQVRGERNEVIRHRDNLVTEGEFMGKTTSQDELRKFTRGDRAEIVRHEDHLKMEGELSFKPSNKDHFQGGKTGSERLPLIKPRDNLQIEGELTITSLITYLRLKNKCSLISALNVTIHHFPLSLSFAPENIHLYTFNITNKFHLKQSCMQDLPASMNILCHRFVLVNYPFGRGIDMK